MAEPAIFTTAEWGAQPAHTAGFPTESAEGIVVHNTQTTNRNPQSGPPEQEMAFALARQIQEDHFARGFADTGQHFTLSRGGLVLEGRHGSLDAARTGNVIKGAHAESVGNVANRRFYGIEVEGDNRQEAGGDHVTPEQFSALVELCAWLSTQGDFDSQHIVPHNQVLSGHTDCPGLFAARMGELRTQVHLRKLMMADGADPGQAGAEGGSPL
ncbi:MAG: N-acetylmuramoyl-L-alanine amidase [Abitibacteriaceae bacterium]|nr:N-acetylmuramoyl-L-alanine amidase [Abditibacteriaceae bacterium]